MDSYKAEKLKDLAILVLICTVFVVMLIFLFVITLDGTLGIILGRSWDLVLAYSRVK
jgi:hypothetical protein